MSGGSGYYYVSTRFATGAVYICKDEVTSTPPIWRKWIGKTVFEMFRAIKPTHVASMFHPEDWQYLDHNKRYNWKIKYDCSFGDVTFIKGQVFDAFPPHKDYREGRCVSYTVYEGKSYRTAKPRSVAIPLVAVDLVPDKEGR